MHRRWSLIFVSVPDLSLTIQLGDSTLNVVDSVSGRIRKKTMTALMGGSGAGTYKQMALGPAHEVPLMKSRT